jgi:hypothetical protein
MCRYKTMIGGVFTPSNQQTEAKIRGNVLNQVTSLGMPAFARVR